MIKIIKFLLVMKVAITQIIIEETNFLRVNIVEGIYPQFKILEKDGYEMPKNKNLGMLRSSARKRSAATRRSLSCKAT